MLFMAYLGLCVAYLQGRHREAEGLPRGPGQDGQVWAGAGTAVRGAGDRARTGRLANDPVRLASLAGRAGPGRLHAAGYRHCTALLETAARPRALHGRQCVLRAPAASCRAAAGT